jgi:hypothetical protein
VTQLVDDQLLSAILRGESPPAADPEAFTTGYWYTRLCQAVLGASERAGVLSGPFAALPEPLRARAMRSVLELPESIGLLSLRTLAPAIGSLRQRYALNVLGMEALAAACELGADVYLSASSPGLEEALRSEGIRVTVAGPRR